MKTLLLLACMGLVAQGALAVSIDSTYHVYRLSRDAEADRKYHADYKKERARERREKNKFTGKGMPPPECLESQTHTPLGTCYRKQ